MRPRSALTLAPQLVPELPACPGAWAGVGAAPPRLTGQAAASAGWQGWGGGRGPQAGGRAQLPRPLSSRQHQRLPPELLLLPAGGGAGRHPAALPRRVREVRAAALPAPRGARRPEGLTRAGHALSPAPGTRQRLSVAVSGGARAGPSWSGGGHCPPAAGSPGGRISPGAAGGAFAPEQLSPCLPHAPRPAFLALRLRRMGARGRGAGRGVARCCRGPRWSPSRPRSWRLPGPLVPGRGGRLPAVRSVS